MMPGGVDPENARQRESSPSSIDEASIADSDKLDELKKQIAAVQAQAFLQLTPMPDKQAPSLSGHEEAASTGATGYLFLSAPQSHPANSDDWVIIASSNSSARAAWDMSFAAKIRGSIAPLPSKS